MADFRRALRRGLRRVFFMLVSLAVRLRGFDGARRLGSAIGNLEYTFGGSGRKRCLSDLALLQNRTPDDPLIARQLRESCRVYMGAMIEVVAMFLHKLDAATLNARCRVDGVAILEAARDDRGAILLATHSGNTLLAAAQLASKGWPVTIVYRQSRMMSADFFAEGLPRYGMESIPANEGVKAYKEMLRALRKNRVVFVMIDQGVKYEKDGMPMRFLGKDMPMPMGPAHLLRKSGAPVLPLVTLAARPVWHFEIQAPVPVMTQGTLEDDMSTLVRITERQVLDRPELWSWHQRRWRKFPLAAPLS